MPQSFQESHPNPNEIFPMRGTLGSPGSGAEAVLANLLAAAAALALALGSLFYLYIDCIAISIHPTSARMEVTVFNRDPEEKIRWYLLPGPEPEPEDVPPIPEKLLTLLESDKAFLDLTDLTPGNVYTLLFFGEDEAGETELVHMFEFRTPGAPGEEPAPGADTPDPSPDPEPDPPAPPPGPDPDPEPDPPAPPPGPDPDPDPPIPPVPPVPPPDPDPVPPVVQPPEMANYVAPAEEGGGSYQVHFPFLLNDGIPQSIRVTGTLSSRSAFYEPPVQTAVDVTFPGDALITDSAGRKILAFDVAGAYTGVDLTAELTYNFGAGTPSASLTSDLFRAHPGNLTVQETGSRNTLTAQLQGNTLNCTLLLHDFQAGTYDYRVQTLDLWCDGTETPVRDLTSWCDLADSTVTCTFSFDLPGTADPLPGWVELDIWVSGDCYLGGMPMGLPSESFLITDVILGDAYSAAPVAVPEGLTVNGLTCTGIFYEKYNTYSRQLDRAAPGQTIALCIYLTGEVTESFYLTPQLQFNPDVIPNYDLSSAVDTCIYAGETQHRVLVFFTMPAQNIASGDIQLLGFTWRPDPDSQPGSAQSAAPEVPDQEAMLNALRKLLQP